MCLYPKLIENPKYRKNKKNGGNIPPVSDKRVLLVPVGCGKCLECRKKRKREWQVRLSEEIRTNKTGKFVTFTFSPEHLSKLRSLVDGLSGYDLDNEVAIIAVKRFRERWRKFKKKSPRYWLVTELGQSGTERLHLHGIVFTDEEYEFIKDRWMYGHVWIGNYVNQQTINYIVKYVSKVDKLHPKYTSRILCSHGIGRSFVDSVRKGRNKFVGKDTKETYIDRKGFKRALPIYYRNHVYSEEEREKLWIQKLDEQKRYVLGVAYDVSKDDRMYYAALKAAREKNDRLGYGDDTINWDKKRYNRQKSRLRKRG